MKMFCGVVFLAFTGSAVRGYAQLGEEVSHDARVKEAIEKIGWNYEIDSDGDFKLVLEFEDERSQLVYVNSNTETYREFEIREVWSIGYIAENSLPQEVALTLLEDNYDKKIGAWNIQHVENQYVAVFAAKISALMTPDQLKSIILIVVESADELEKKLTDGGDDY
jgi:hypothetical protein